MEPTQPIKYEKAKHWEKQMQLLIKESLVLKVFLVEEKEDERAGKKARGNHQLSREFCCAQLLSASVETKITRTCSFFALIGTI